MAYILLIGSTIIIIMSIQVAAFVILWSSSIIMFNSHRANIS